jgi:hypothetical protein
MRLMMLGGIIAALSWAQEQAPPGIVRGDLSIVEKSSFQVRSLDGNRYKCTFDARTYIERDNQRIFPAALRVNDPVEVVTDRSVGRCYARTIRVVIPPPPLKLLGSRQTRLVQPRRVFDTVFPRGNLTFAGVVRRISPEMLVLYTRDEPEKIVLLRDDTRYLASGLPSAFSELAVNTRVFIRGGQNFEKNLEAYQIVWGEIAGPKSRD